MCSNLWLSGSDTQFMMGISGCRVTLWPIVEHSISIKAAHQQAKSVSQKESSYPQRIAGLCSKILRACALIHLWGAAKSSKQHCYLPLTFQELLDLLDPMVQAAQQLAWQPRPVAEPSLVMAPFKTNTFSDGSVSGSEYHTQMQKMLSLKSKEAHQTLCLFIYLFILVVGEARCNNLPFTLKGISRHAPYHWISRNFTEVEAP